MNFKSLKQVLVVTIVSSIISALIIACLPSCKLDPATMTPAQRAEAESLKAEHEKAKQDAAGAVTPEAKDEAEKKVAMTEKEMADFEAKVIMERAGPLVAGLSAIHPSLGWLSSLMPLAPLIGSRGRRHFWNAVKDVNPWAGKEQGAEPGIAPIAAVQDLLRMWGVLHSNEASKTAFEGVGASNA